MPAPRIYNSQGLVGGGGGGGYTPDQKVDEIKTYPFSFSDSSPINAIQLEAGVKVLSVAVKITTPFNDTASEIMVGYTGNLNAYMGIEQNVASETGEYETNPYRTTPSSEYVILSIDKKTSTQGAGVLIVEIDKP